MLLGLILSAFYAITLRKETWSAKQSLIVRDDLLGQSHKPGQFDSLDSMKSAQETILEIARKPQVIKNALQQLGPPSRGFMGLVRGGYPSEEIIELTQGQISLSAPNGAEYGQTEVIILSTKSGSRERAKEFTKILVGEIIAKVNDVRQRKFKSMAAEILETCKIAESSLEDSKQQLKQMDSKLGEDAGAMVAMGESSFRDDPLSREIAQLNLERRAVRSEVEQISSMLESLKAAKKDPEAIVNISSDLTGRQPALESLKQEMVQQKGDYALLSGRYTDVHPAVVSARDGIRVMENQIRLELSNAEADTMSQLEIATAKLNRLDVGINKLKTRMANLGEMRADSITLFADIKKRTEVLNNARSNLAEVQGLANTTNADVLTTVDEVQVSTRPDGLGKKALILSGGLGGLMLGMGLVMLMAPNPYDPLEASRNFESLDSTALAPNTESDEQPVQPLDVGLAKAQAGLATSSSVLKDLIRPSSKPRVPENQLESAEEETPKQQKTIDRLESFKSHKPKKYDPETLDSPSPDTSLPTTEAELKNVLNESSVESSVESKPAPTSEIEDSVAQESESNLLSQLKAQAQELEKEPEQKVSTTKKAVGATILPTSNQLAAPSPAPSVEPAELLKAAAAQASSKPQSATPMIEIPDVEPQQPEGNFTKMVDKAFENEDETKSRLEAQTIQLDVLSKVLGATGAAGAAGLAAKAVAGTQETELPNPSAKQATSAKRGAQILPRSENVRPVDLARQADNDGFDRVEPAISKTVPGPLDEMSLTEEIPEPSDKTKNLLSQGGNPFLRDRSSASKSSEKASSEKAPSAPAPSAFNDDVMIQPVPDQIRKLSDSIASFAKPIKGGGLGKEKF